MVTPLPRSTKFNTGLSLYLAISRDLLKTFSNESNNGFATNDLLVFSSLHKIQSIFFFK